MPTRIVARLPDDKAQLRPPTLLRSGPWISPIATVFEVSLVARGTRRTSLVHLLLPRNRFTCARHPSSHRQTFVSFFACLAISSTLACFRYDARSHYPRIESFALAEAVAKHERDGTRECTVATTTIPLNFLSFSRRE